MVVSPETACSGCYCIPQANQELNVDITYYEELAHTATEAKKAPALPFANWSLRLASGRA